MILRKICIGENPNFSERLYFNQQQNRKDVAQTTQPKDGGEDSDHTHRRQRRPEGDADGWYKQQKVATAHVLHALNGQTPDH